MNIALWLKRSAQAHPNRPALFLGRDCVADYGDFHDQALILAGALRALGIKAGDRVAIFMQNCPDYLILKYGIWYAGAVAVPINAKLHGREAAYILQDSGAALVFTSPEQADSVREHAADVPLCVLGDDGHQAMMMQPPLSDVTPRAPDDLAWLFYTSGTTGKPKGVMITHRMLVSVSLCYVTDVDEVRSQDATIYAAPMSHGAGLYSMVHVRAGARHICPPSTKFDPHEILDLAAHFGSAQVFAAPTMVSRLTAFAKSSGDKGEGLRTIVYAGGPMYSTDIIEAEDHFGPIFVQIYGQGECPMGITALSRHDVSDRDHPRWQQRLGSVGRAQSCVEVAIGDEKGALLPPETSGEILVRGDAVMPGYWQNKSATQKALRNGWLHTGDLGQMDRHGYVTLQDRANDMIITGGSNVYPREVEEVLLTHPDLREVSVVGRPHPDWGEEVIAFVVGTAADAELDALCRDNIAGFKRPKAYIRVQDLPKNNYGKVLKTELRKLAQG